MRAPRLSHNTDFFRPTICLPLWIGAVVGLFFVFSQAVAQRVGGDEARRGMERIDEEEGALRLESFRQQRLDGDFVFEFQLEHKPRRGRTVRYDGIMWGSWNEQGPITRFAILPDGLVESDFESSAIEVIVQNGPAPQAWIKKQGEDGFVLIEDEALFEPILPGVLYSVFDLQMPFIYWQDYVYEGPALVGASRVAQRFLMLPPEGSVSMQRGIKGVRIGLDDTYNALWRIEVINEDGSVGSRFAVESFKKVEEQYIVKRITLTDYPSKDRTTFNVTEASVGLELDAKNFEVPAKSVSEQSATPCCRVQ